MNREYHRWHSPHLGRDMELLVFGHAGAKVLVFPTRDGRFDEYEHLRITEALRHKLDQAARTALNSQLKAALGSDTRLEPSRKPHLLFVSHDHLRATSQQLLAVIREQGVSAHFVDL